MKETIDAALIQIRIEWDTVPLHDPIEHGDDEGRRDDQSGHAEASEAESTARIVGIGIG
ncbi:hypothetical protein [uncultured Methylobacterium sp.]|uniref:hypothetical protein n=1 Tax=uncultured Methylobacterium sp. TaxID=157278 RepID=UPI002592D169|nr:hypothetical protein [uncultured Methylobacterium sp.]